MYAESTMRNISVQKVPIKGEIIRTTTFFSALTMKSKAFILLGTQKRDDMKNLSYPTSNIIPPYSQAPAVICL